MIKLNIYLMTSKLEGLFNWDFKRFIYM